MDFRTRFELFRSSDSLVLFTICTAMFTDGFIYGIVAPVIPFILQDQKLVTESEMQSSTSLLIAAFSLADFFGAPLCAWYVDRSESQSRRIPWYIGIALITTGSILFGCTNGLAMLIVSRILQGLSSSILYTVGLAVLVDTVGKNEVGQWMGTAMSCNNIGIILSPLMGGIIYDWAGKKAVFATMMLLGAFDIALRVLMKEKPRKELSSNTSAGVISEKLPGCQYEELRQDSSTDWSLPITNEKSSEPDEHEYRTASSSRFQGVLSLVRSPRLLAALYGCFINECIVASLCAVLPLFVHETFHWTALPAGLLFLTIAIPALAGPVAGAASDRFGARWVAVAGFAATAPSLWMLRFVEGDGLGMKVLLCGLLTLMGSTVIFFLSPLGAECSFVAEEKSEDMNCDLFASSFSLMNCALAAAGLVGPLAAGGLQDAFGWKATTLALGVLCISGVVSCVLATSGRETKNEIQSSRGREDYELCSSSSTASDTASFELGLKDV